MRVPYRLVALVGAAVLMVTACQQAAPTAPATTPSGPAAATRGVASPETRPAPSPAASPSPVAAGPSPACPDQPASAGGKKLRVGLVTDVGKIDDKSFNQSAWEGVECARKNLGSETRFIETTDPKDYARNIDQFAQENYDVIVTVGFALNEATVAAARQYSNVTFIGVDQPQGEEVPNLAGLIFPEDKSGYLAGYLAGLMTGSNTVGQVLGTPVVPPVEAFGVGFISGARAARPDVKVLSACHPGGLATGFRDPEWGKDAARLQMEQGADVIFAAGGQTGNGGLLAIAERGGSVLGIGVDSDQYYTLPEARSILLSSAMKLITPGVFELIKAAHDGGFKGGNTLGSVALAPYHDLESRVPAEVKSKIQQVTTDVLAGKVDTKWSARPTGNCPQP
jgi:basic membrane protein A and related proteins